MSVFGSGGKLAVFLLWRESFITTGKKKVPVVCLAGCAVVSVFGSGDYDRKKKKLQSSVWRVVLLCQFLVLTGNWQFFCRGRKVLLQPKKKSSRVQLELKLIQIR